MDGYILDEGYATVGEFGVPPTSPADCPAGTYYGMLPNGTYTCSPNIQVGTGGLWRKAWFRLPGGYAMTTAYFVTAALIAGVGYAGYRFLKKHRATVAGLNDCGCDED